MRTSGGRRSTHVDDRRTGGGVAVASPLVGCGSLLVGIVWVLLGGDPRDAASLASATQELAAGLSEGSGPPSTEDAPLVDFVRVVLADTEDVWSAIFRAGGRAYQEPELVLFTGRVDSACGGATSAIGPFYCSGDQKVYIDLGFYRELKSEYGAPGDFAQAYVIAHEIGHHVQQQLGISAQVARAERGKPEVARNALSVRQELQADCFAGVWAHHAERDRHLLEEGDIDEALRAANAIGDDALQHAAGGDVVPESFTHGTSQMRKRWWMAGMKGGRLEDCDTFAASADAVGLSGGR
jgi:predicted metalloprotease